MTHTLCQLLATAIERQRERLDRQQNGHNPLDNCPAESVTVLPASQKAQPETHDNERQ
jgi:hypothetical protein